MHRLTLLTTFCVVFATVSPLAAKPPAGQPPSAEQLQELDTLALQELEQSQTPGAALAIVQGDRVIHVRGFGLANVETGLSVTPEMLFRLGSTTKMFTAAALVALAEEGKLQLDAPVGKVVPDLHPRIAALTAHQLLTHTAGLTDESIMSGLHDDAALGAGVRAMDAGWLFTEPGHIHSYANPGYWIAGLACEQIAGRPCADVLAERLFRPLGMQRTTLRPMLAMTWPLALGHEVRDGAPAIVRPQADNAGTWPAGQIYSNVHELARFTIAFMNEGQLEGRPALSTHVIRQLSEPRVSRPGTDDHYGYGLVVGKEHGTRLLSHGGSRSGYGSTIRMAPEEKVAVIVLTNRTGSSLPKTAARALRIMLAAAPLPEPRPTPPAVPESEHARIAGVYTNHRQTLELTVQEGSLQLRRRTGDGRLGTAQRVLFSDANQLTVSGESATASATLYLVRAPDGTPEYLCSGSRAYKRQAAQTAQ